MFVFGASNVIYSWQDIGCTMHSCASQNKNIPFQQTITDWRQRGELPFRLAFELSLFGLSYLFLWFGLVLGFSCDCGGGRGGYRGRGGYALSVSAWEYRTLPTKYRLWALRFVWNSLLLKPEGGECHLKCKNRRNLSCLLLKHPASLHNTPRPPQEWFRRS